MTAKPNGRQRAKSARKAKPQTLPARHNPATEYPASPYPLILSAKHQAFVAHYLVTFNGAEAARLAGYKVKHARTTASEILAYPDVKAEIVRRRWAMSENLQNISRERFEREIATAAFANFQDFAPMFGEGTVPEKLALLTREQAAAVSEITVEEFRDGRTTARQVRRTKFKLVPKNASLELLGKAKGWVSEKVDVKHDHQHLILAIMLKEIADREEGKPIIDTTMSIDDQRPVGDAA